MLSRHLRVRAVALVTLGSGITNIVSVMGHGIPRRLEILTDIFPLEFIHFSRYMTLLIGFALVISAINIYKRKRRAFQIVLLLSLLSMVGHVTKGLNVEEALLSFLLIVLLILTRRSFSVRSSVPSLRWGAVRLATAILVAFGYGVGGFWFLERRDFGLEFHIGDALHETLLFLGLVGDPGLVPLTHHAHWFLNSLYGITLVTIVYGLQAVLRPAIYEFRTHPQERALAKGIVTAHGRSALDFFKYWPDKSYFFLPSQRTVIAYRVGGGFAVVLSDPVGPEEEIEEIIKAFNGFCDENDWNIYFHQTLPDFLPIYERLGFRKLKIGEDAIVDLAHFSLQGGERKELRHTVNKLESEGFHFRSYEPPLSAEVLSRLQEISNDWLTIPGRRERSFTLGLFDPAYIRETPVFATVDAQETILAFTNQIPSFHPGEATIDLMRRHSHAPKGVMDYLFTRLFVFLKEKGFQRFNLGLAPMSSYTEDEETSLEEKAIHYFFQHVNLLFSYRGLQQYKAKFAASWEPRYAIYRNQLDLPRIGLALRAVSEVKDRVR